MLSAINYSHNKNKNLFYVQAQHHEIVRGDVRLRCILP
jgi:hypothetical protein